MTNIGAASFMTKPPRSSALFDTINSVVHKKLTNIERKEQVHNLKNHSLSPTLLTEEPKNSTDPMNKIEILIAEDNEVNQMFGKEIGRIVWTKIWMII